MTCIIGLLDDGDIYMGADSAGTNSIFQQYIRADEKVFINGGFIMGFTDSFRMGQLLRYSLTPPKYHPDDNIDSFMCTTFINAIRDCLKKGGYAEKENEVETGGNFIVGFVGKLFEVGSDYQVIKVFDNFISIGAGRDIALGSLYTTDKPAFDPIKRIELALAATECYNAAVKRPFNIIKLDKRKDN